MVRVADDVFYTAGYRSRGIMRRQLQGISLILFGILLALFALVNPWIPIIDDLLGTVSGYASIICGIIGVILALKKD